MYIVGMFVLVDPDSFDLVVPEVKSLCSVEIKLMEQELGKMVLAVTSSSEQQNKLVFDKIKSLPFVMAAEVIYFYRDDELETELGDLDEENDLNSKELQTYRSYNSIIHTQH